MNVAAQRYELDGLVVVITGAAGGIGEATARLAASNGARVALVDMRAEAAEKAASSIRSAGGEAVSVACDITDEASVAAMIATVVRAFGGIDVLHNNAATTDAQVRDDLTLEGLEMRDWDLIQNVNVRGAVLCAQHALPHLRLSRNASVINASSKAALAAHQNTIAYGTSKTALVGLTRNLAVAMATDGIRVNCYCPGIVETQMLADYIATRPDPAAFERELASESLVARLGRAEEIAHLVCFLASPHARFVNGAVWPIDGGSTAWRGTADWRAHP